MVGCRYEKSSDSPHTLLIFEDTSKEWSIALHGAFSQSVVVATSYATLGIDAVAAAINQTGAPTILCNRKLVPKVQNPQAFRYQVLFVLFLLCTN